LLFSRDNTGACMLIHNDTVISVLVISNRQVYTT